MEKSTHAAPVQEDYFPDEKNSQHVIGDSSSENATLSEFTPAEEKKLMHKIDRRLVLTVGVMYCVSLMDRTNLGSASIAGLVKINHNSLQVN
jgi:hypothetical protein